MKSVLLSTRPKWCELIASGRKTIEVRKSRPQLETPFKCYIYETAQKYKKGTGVFLYGIELQGTAIGRGKVVGEFVCDRITKIHCWEDTQTVSINEKLACLSEKAICEYLNYKEGYGWHISDLKIYDKPKELGEFRKPCKWEEKGEEPDCFICNKSGYTPDMQIDCFNTVKTPPQSWCYVEEL